MAEIEMEEIMDLIEGAEESIDAADEEAEGMPEDAREEIEGELAEARAEVAEFSRITESLRTLADLAKTYILKVAKFVGESVAIGVILWGVNTTLNKIAHQDHQQSSDVKKKLAAIKALTTVIKTQSDLGKKTLEWMKKHKDDVITLDKTEVPLESVIAKYITPISGSVNGAFKTAKSLQDKVDGKIHFNIPTGEDVREFLAAGDSFLKGFSDLVTFITTKGQKIEQLATFPVKQADIDLLTTQLKAAKDLPLW